MIENVLSAASPEATEPPRRLYPALSTYRSVLRAIGIVAIILIAVGVASALQSLPPDASTMYRLAIIGAGFLFACGFGANFILAELIQLFLDIQDNTYLTAYNTMNIDADFEQMIGRRQAS